MLRIADFSNIRMADFPNFWMLDLWISEFPSFCSLRVWLFKFHNLRSSEFPNYRFVRLSILFLNFRGFECLFAKFVKCRIPIFESSNFWFRAPTFWVSACPSIGDRKYFASVLYNHWLYFKICQYWVRVITKFVTRLLYLAVILCSQMRLRLPVV